MQISKSDLFHPTDSSPREAKIAATGTSASGIGGDSLKSERVISHPFSESANYLRFDLAKKLPTLWSKAQRDFSAGKTDHEKEKLRSLILWLLAKKDFAYKQHYPISYQHEGRRTAGRIDVVVVSNNQPFLAIEMDWAYSLKSLEKLRAAHLEGLDVIWVCGANISKEAASTLRKRANHDLSATYKWLYIFHLTHGWL